MAFFKTPVVDIENDDNHFVSEQEKYIINHQDTLQKIMDTFPNMPEGKILYDFTSHQYTNFMEIKGLGAPALHEIHIFLSCTNPNQEMIERYNHVCQIYNEVNKANPPNDRFKEMKAPYLALYYRNKGQYVFVLQSSRYFLSDDKEEIIRQTYRDAELFTTVGFDVIRLKIEASLHGMKNLPRTGKELTTYYEHHIRVENLKGETNEEQDVYLNSISLIYSDKFKIPIPFSYNANATGGQRYLNVRFRNMSAQESLDRTREVMNHINGDKRFKVVKSIDEIIVCDSFPELDKGWIDFTDTEMEMFCYKAPPPRKITSFTLSIT
jgi:hypothetical protein